MTTKLSNETFGSRVRRLREQKGWSLSELSTRADISRSYLAQIEADKSAPTEDKIMSLANALGARPSELLGESVSSTHIPPSLQQFAKRMNLGSAEIEMLAQIQYRGRKPTTEAEWRAIYSLIKGLLDDEA